ncbi:Signal transduction histidine kinase [Sphingomonas gellani]|uniref:histidine kinase n=1 Tax=Sphingomonas gellani TaxID=1166340 RepID=A0A1H8HHN7_9SPHN|nr:ATP-binding protein [Sphingomonas gellani]SEN55655.1 Signal transduction histidine kinase [Sphingomonas gellani]
MAIGRLPRWSGGLVGRIVAILLLTLMFEFAASTLLYERASQFSVRDDEARRLAEHLVISRKLMAEQPVEQRGDMAAELTTTRYTIAWNPAPPPPPPIAPALDTMRRQIIDWEPALRGTDLHVRLTSPGRGAVVSGALRLPDDGWLYFRTREPVKGINLAMERILLALVPAAALMVLGGTMVRRTMLPLRRLTEAADRVGSGAEAPVPEDGTGDVRRVTVAFNRMQDRIRRLIAGRTQALAAVGHDLRTPLARLRLRAEAIETPELRHAIGEDVAEMDAMVASLLAFLGGDSDPESPVLVDVAVMAATLVDDAMDRGREADYDGPDHCELWARPVGLKRALTNLVDNALHYGDRIRVVLEPGEDEVAIHVDDDGPGIAPDKLEEVLQPFVRLDPARGRDTVGFGLGLPIVVQAIGAEGGRLALCNRAGGGLRATVILPKNDH